MGSYSQNFSDFTPDGQVVVWQKVLMQCDNRRAPPSEGRFSLTNLKTMLKLSVSFAALAILLPFVTAQSAVWGQCK